MPWEERLNVHAALMAVQRNPMTTDGQKTTPVVWDANCLEEVCGSCTMIINGRVHAGLLGAGRPAGAADRAAADDEVSRSSAT